MRILEEFWYGNNTDRWVAFIAYIFIAMVCGFVEMKKSSKPP